VKSFLLFPPFSPFPHFPAFVKMEDYEREVDRAYEEEPVLFHGEVIHQADAQAVPPRGRRSAARAAARDAARAARAFEAAAANAAALEEQYNAAVRAAAEIRAAADAAVAASDAAAITAIETAAARDAARAARAARDAHAPARAARAAIDSTLERNAFEITHRLTICIQDVVLMEGALLSQENILRNLQENLSSMLFIIDNCRQSDDVLENLKSDVPRATQEIEDLQDHIAVLRQQLDAKRAEQQKIKRESEDLDAEIARQLSELQI
jgi:hypothetical protein